MTLETITVQAATGADESDWNAFVNSAADAEIYHQFAWKRLLERVFGHECHYLLARDAEGSACGVLPLVHLKSRVFGNFLVSIPCFNYCGILAVNDAARLALQNAAGALGDELRASHVELRHRSHVELDLPRRDDKVSMQLRLPESADQLWSAFPSKLRSQIRRPGKAGAVCERGGVELLDEFYEVFSRNMRDLGTPVFPRMMFAEVHELFPEETDFYVVRLGGKPVAAAYTIGHRDTLEIPSASALREFSRSAPNMLLYWTVLQSAIEQGYTVFDFGRTSRDSGPYRFKRQWGAEERPLAWHYILREGSDLPKISPDNPKYRFAVNVWRRLPVPVANVLGPQVVKHLP
jgi:FemAB-related protein (PEP-CTERM system-associated)